MNSFHHLQQAASRVSPARLGVVTSANGASGLQMVALVKGGHCYCYRYADAKKAEAILALGRAAADSTHALTWEEAALLSRFVNDRAAP